MPRPARAVAPSARAAAVARWIVLIAAVGCSDSAPSCPAGSRSLDGRCIKACTIDRDCLADEVCGDDGLCGPPADGPALILAFSVAPGSVSAGQSVQIGYSVANAQSVRVEIRRRADGGVEWFATSQDSFSDIFVSPALPEDVTITLIAFGDGGAPAIESRDVDVESPTSVAIESFTATPSVVDPGDSTTLAWSVRNGTGTVSIADEDGVTVVVQGTSYEVEAVEQTTTFTLTASGSQGDTDTDTVTVTVRNPNGPQVVTFNLEPTAVDAGDGALVTWTTSGANRVEIRAPVVNGSLMYASTDPEYVRSGALIVDPQAFARYVLVASLGTDSDTESVQVTVFPRPPVAEITSFEVTPSVVTPVTTAAHVFQWTAGPNNASTSLFLDGELVQEDFRPTDTYEVSLFEAETVVAELKVDAPGGVDRRRARVWAVTDEAEPNDQRLTATRISNEAVQGSLPGLGVDEDWYVVDIEDNESIGVRFLDRSECDTSFVVELWNEDGLIVDQQPDNTGRCPAITKTLLPSGTYYVVVREVSDTGFFPYRLAVAVEPPQCGDGVTLFGEECDDGNTRFGDGCSAFCEFESAYEYEGESISTPMWDPLPDVAVSRPLLPYAENQPVSQSDEGFAVVELPFPFLFYGRTYVAVAIHANGFLSFRALEGGAAAEPRQPLGPSPPNAVVAALGVDAEWPPDRWPSTWEDSNAELGAIFWIDFSDATIKGDADTFNQVRVGLTDSGAIVFRYGEVGTTQSFGAGIEDHSGNYRFSLCKEGRCADGREISNSVIVVRNTGQ